MKDRWKFLGWFDDDDDDGERMRLSVVSFLSRAFRMVSSRRRSVEGGSREYTLLFVIDLLHGVKVGSRDWKGDILGCRRFLLLLLLLLQNAKKVAIYNFEIMSHGFDQW